MQVVIRCAAIGYIPNPKHTVEYRDNMVQWSGESSKRIPEGNIYWILAPSKAKSLQMMRDQLKDYIERISWLGAKIEDIWFDARIENVQPSGLFWPPVTMSGEKYRLSDLTKGSWK